MIVDPKTVAKNWVRPGLIPLFRLYFRYIPLEYGKSAIWKVFGNLFQFADHRFAAQTSFGMTITGNTIDEIQRRIYYFGLWEPNLTAFLERRLIPGDIFVDVGANIGYFSLLASKLVGPTGKVLAIEASPYIFEQLVHNIRQNQLENVSALNFAVSDSDGVARVYLGPDGNIGQTTILANEGHRFETEVRSRRLDELLSAEDLNRVKIIKIDVEGAEWSVISGMPQILESCPDTLEIVIEISPERLSSCGQSASEVQRVFERAGFYAYELINDYSDSAYLRCRHTQKPRRLRTPNEDRTIIDLVFSKKSLDFL